jgi:outer membrane biosynthesis protein TonB
MSRTKTFKHRWLGPVLIGLLLVAALVLAGCGAEQEVAQEPAAPTSMPTEAEAPTSPPTEPPPTEVPTEPPAPTEPPTPTKPPPTDTPEPTEEPTPEAVDDTACIGCHTDEETLKAVAEVEEVEEALSEGEG